MWALVTACSGCKAAVAPGTPDRLRRVPEVAAKEEGARLACGDQRLSGKIGCYGGPLPVANAVDFRLELHPKL